MLNLGDALTKSGNNFEVPLNKVKNFVLGDHSDYCL